MITPLSSKSLFKIIISGFQMINVQPIMTAKIPVLLDISVPVTKDHVRSIKERRPEGQQQDTVPCMQMDSLVTYSVRRVWWALAG